MTSATTTPARDTGGHRSEGQGYLRTWGWITLVIGALQLIAAAGVGLCAYGSRENLAAYRASAPS